jgi:hypothetical protein
MPSTTSFEPAGSKFTGSLVSFSDRPSAATRSRYRAVTPFFPFGVGRVALMMNVRSEPSAAMFGLVPKTPGTLIWLSCCPVCESCTAANKVSLLFAFNPSSAKNLGIGVPPAGAPATGRGTSGFGD